MQYVGWDICAPQLLQCKKQKYTIIHSNESHIKYQSAHCLIVHVKLNAWKCQIKKVWFNLTRGHQIQKILLDKVQRQQITGRGCDFIHPSIFISSGSRRGKVLLTGLILQLLLGDSKAFPGQIGYVIPPVCSGLALGSSAS